MVIQYRKYKNYKEYLKHQKNKLDTQCDYFKTEFDRRFLLIKNRIDVIAGYIDNKNKNVLCLGARLGEEVKAFRQIGFEAIGIDLNPGKDNPYVVQGDFHSIPFPDGAFNFVYCNCLDHAFDLKKVSVECNRVLNNDGHILIELGRSEKLKIGSGGDEHIKKANSFESLIWDKMESVVNCFDGFERVNDFDTDESYHCFILRKV